MHIFIYTCIYTCTHVQCIHMHVCVDMYMHANMYTHAHTYSQTHISLTKEALNH